MALPDALERIGIVVGSALLLALPTSALASLLSAGPQPTLFAVLAFAPGLVVGALVATGRLPVTYHQVWQFSLASWFVAALGVAFLELGRPPSGPILGFGWWLVSVAVGVAVARFPLRESLAAVR